MKGIEKRALAGWQSLSWEEMVTYYYSRRVTLGTSVAKLLFACGQLSRKITIVCIYSSEDADEVKLTDRR